MGDKFQTNVYVSNPETGDAAWFAPGDDVPEWAEGCFDPAHTAVDEGLAAAQAGGSAEPVDYSAMTKAQLESLAADRDIDFSGTKADIIARLEESDAALK